MLITNIVTAVLIIVSVMLFNPKVAAAMIVALAGGYVLIYLVVRNRLVRAGEIQTHFFIEQTKIVNETLAAIKEILVLGTQNYFQNRFARSSQAFAQAVVRTQMIGQSPRYVMECVAVVGLIAAALLAAQRSEGIGVWLGQLTFLGFAAYRLLPALQQAFVAIVGIRADRAGFASITPDLRLARARKHAAAANFPWRKNPGAEIRLKEVSFRYEPDRPWAVSGVTLRIPAGAAAGFVGPNGSGKTTLVDLVAGLLVPDAGQIAIDGIALTDANRVSWQARIAYVPQRICMLDASIAQNIALGVAPAAIDRERLLEASRLAQLDDLIAALPAGFDHMVGETGMRLSGGQRQRIGIARALYADASVLILDEATNALDGLTEQELLTTIGKLRGRYTILLIAHRSSSVRACNLIFEMERGIVKASGSYSELIKNSGTFRGLIETPQIKHAL